MTTRFEIRLLATAFLALFAAPTAPVFAVTLDQIPATTQQRVGVQPLSDPLISTRIDREVKSNCTDARRKGDVEHAICLAEGRKNAYRAAAGIERKPF